MSNPVCCTNRASICCCAFVPPSTIDSCCFSSRSTLGCPSTVPSSNWIAITISATFTRSGAAAKTLRSMVFTLSPKNSATTSPCFMVTCLSDRFITSTCASPLRSVHVSGTTKIPCFVAIFPVCRTCPISSSFPAAEHIACSCTPTHAALADVFPGATVIPCAATKWTTSSCSNSSYVEVTHPPNSLLSRYRSNFTCLVIDLI